MSSKTFNFTQRSLDALKPHPSTSRSTCAEYSDQTQTGLKLQVSKTGTKTFWFRYIFDGRKRSQRIGEYPGISIVEARQLAQGLRASLDRGVDPNEAQDRLAAMPSFAEFAMQEYLPHARQTKRSAEDDESKLRLYLLPALGSRRLSSIRTRDIQQYLNGLTHLTEATRNRHLALLSKLFKLAVQWDRLERNPCEGIRMYREVIKQQRFLDIDEVRRLIEAARREDNASAGAAIEFLALTGIRRNEALLARWEHVDDKERTLFLPQTKNGNSRYVYLNDAAMALLQRLPWRHRSEHLFPGKEPGKPLNNPIKAFHRILKAARLGNMRLHDLRHTYASTLLSQGATLFQVQHSLGHRSHQSTQRYSHIRASGLHDVSQLMSKALEPKI